MFCPKCGQEMLSQARFCAHCGTDVQGLLQQLEKVPSVSQESEPEIPKPQNDSPAPDTPAQEIHKAFSEEAGASPNTSDSDPLAAIIGKNQAYYLTEFQKIQSGKKSRFNWAAFFFGPAFCLYRKCEDLFTKYFLLPISLTLVGYIVQTIGTVQFNLMLITGGGIITGGGGILGFISLIRLGLRFNQFYYERCSGPVSPDRSGTSIKAAVVFYTVVILAVALIYGAGAIMIRHQYSTIFEQDAPGRFDISDIQGSLVNTSGSPSQSVDVPFGDVGQFDDFVGVWEREGNGGGYLLISYEDETAQRAYAEVAVGNIYFVAELTRISDESIYGVSLENEYEIDLSQNGSELDAAIFYSERLVDYISFVPGGYGDEIYGPDGMTQPFDLFVGDWYCDESVAGLFIGYGDETKQTAYGSLLTLGEEYHNIEMWMGDGETVEGLLMGYSSEPELALTLTYDGYGLSGSIYYGASDIEEYVYFTPYESPGFQNPYYTS